MKGKRLVENSVWATVCGHLGGAIAGLTGSIAAMIAGGFDLVGLGLASGFVGGFLLGAWIGWVERKRSFFITMVFAGPAGVFFGLVGSQLLLGAMVHFGGAGP